METQTAQQIIDTLAQGVHPVTGEAMPEDSPYHAPAVIRALHVASRALQSLPPVMDAARPGRISRAAPANAGKPWTEEDDAVLCAGFDAGQELRELAERLARTRFGIEQRLVKLGRLPAAPGGGRFGGAPTGGSRTVQAAAQAGA